MMFRNPRLRTVLGAGTALAVVAGIGIGLATSSSAAERRYVTATAGTGDVTQTAVATGSITRKNTSEASFAVDGTVRKVNAAVGDEVDAGEVLAVLDKSALQLAVLNAEAGLARAKASLYSAQHPASVSVPSGGSGGAGGAGVTIDPKLLNEAVARVNLAILKETETCDPVLAAILPEPEPTPSAPSPSATSGATSSPTASGTPTSSATQTASATPTPSATPTASATEQSAKDEGEESTPSPTASASQLGSLQPEEVTDDQLQACADARAEVILANSNLQSVVSRLTGARPAGNKKASSSSSKSSGSSVSASQVASAKADVLKAEQELAKAREDLDDAELVAPISGTVGTVTLTKGGSASAGSVTIVGSGSAVVTFELPLATRQLVKTGQQVSVTPAGSTSTLTGRITTIASLATEGTSGSSATYTTAVSVTDAAGLLATGAKASVLIPVKSASAVLRVPASAVTPTGTGTATVQVVDNAAATTARTVQVKTGAVGGGWVQVTEGLSTGALVVLADTTADIPTNQSNRRLGGTTSRITGGAAQPVTVPASGGAGPTGSGTSTGR